MKTNTTIKTIIDTNTINHPINDAIQAEANKPAELILDKNQEQVKPIL